MTKQSKKLYTDLMNRIAVVMMVNQGTLLVLMSLVSMLEEWLVLLLGELWWIDLTARLLECLTYLLGFAVPTALLYKMNAKAEREIYEPYYEKKEPSALDIAAMLLIGLGATTLAAYANYYILDLFTDYSDFSQEYLWSVTLDTGYQAVVYFVYSAIIPAVAEELLFRRALCSSLKVYGKMTATVVSAVLFSLMHSNIEQSLYTLVAGLLLAWIYLETENVIYPILLHFVNNGISALGDIINAKCSTYVYNAYSTYSEIAVWVLFAASLVYYLLKIIKQGGFIKKLTMKPDENGNEVLPLSVGERVTGFFTVGMIIFIVYSVSTMAFYLLLSTLM